MLGTRLDAVGGGTALRSVRPEDADKPLIGRSVMWEHAHGVDHADALLGIYLPAAFLLAIPIHHDTKRSPSFQF